MWQRAGHNRLDYGFGGGDFNRSYSIQSLREPFGGGVHGGLVAGPAKPVVPAWYRRLGEPLPVDLIL